MFELTNDVQTYHDLAEHGANFVNDEHHHMNQWVLPQLAAGPETLGSNKEYKFS